MTRQRSDFLLLTALTLSLSTSHVFAGGAQSTSQSGEFKVADLGSSAGVQRDMPGALKGKTFFALNVETKGVVKIEAPAWYDIQIHVDGRLALDLTTQQSRQAQVLTNLDAGLHVIEITGADINDQILDGITIAKSGAAPESILNVAQVIDASQAGKIVSGGEKNSSQAAVGKRRANISTGGGAPFVIGGGSSAVPAVAPKFGSDAQPVRRQMSVVPEGMVASARTKGDTSGAGKGDTSGAGRTGSDASEGSREGATESGAARPAKLSSANGSRRFASKGGAGEKFGNSGNAPKSGIKSAIRRQQDDIKTPVEPPKEDPEDGSEMPVEPPVEAPKDDIKTPVEPPKEDPKDGSEMPADPPVEAPKDDTKTPVEPPKEDPKDEAKAPVEPVVDLSKTAQISPISPPENVAITQEIELTHAGDENGYVPHTGATLFGAVQKDSMYDAVEVTVSSSGRSVLVDVGSTTGQFAVRLFPEDLPLGQDVDVTLKGIVTSNEAMTSAPVSYKVQGVQVTDGVGQALSRMTYGATPELYARVRTMGFKAYVDEQLNPETVNNSKFGSMNTNDLLKLKENPYQLLESLRMHMIANASYTEKQLQEVMGNFWMNHFHAVTKDSKIVVENLLDRNYYRENAFSKFHDLLLYSARSPLMSQYLDNDENRADRGINENYARELLELSSVGVDAGYGPDDIIPVAHVLTGWGYQEGVKNDTTRLTYEFKFRPERHSQGDKYIPFLDHTIKGRDGDAGVEEGEELIEILAKHESTKKFICGKLIELFVADEKPEGFVNNCIAKWTETDGDMREVVRGILMDPSFVNSVEYQRNKVRTPFEYTIAAVRAFGFVQPNDPKEISHFYSTLAAVFRDAGYTMLDHPIPTGQAEVKEKWVNSGAMTAQYRRMTLIAMRKDGLHGYDFIGDFKAARLETAEEVAAYILGMMTTDRYTKEEYDALVEVLKGEDGIFEPRNGDETVAARKAFGLAITMPSFHLQ